MPEHPIQLAVLDMAGAAIAAGTLTGAHDEQELRAGATHVVGSVTDFADLLLSS